VSILIYFMNDSGPDDTKIWLYLPAFLFIAKELKFWHRGCWSHLCYFFLVMAIPVGMLTFTVEDPSWTSWINVLFWSLLFLLIYILDELELWRERRRARGSTGQDR
jgi:type VI protein secretion system component VasK